ncbi:MAG: PfkB family carbohydrate kinase, partial [Erysipelotrichaceae bacterium]|nr:PfkB family carbohydrate kinase [Erysipelotrichaceae bacterium]
MKILGLGDNVFDVYQNIGISYPGGNAVNVAVNAAKLGVEASYLGNIADDDLGYYMQYVLKSENVDISHCSIIVNSSTKQCIENIIDGERQFLYNDLGYNYCGEYQIPDDLEYINSFDAILTSCNA